MIGRDGEIRRVIQVLSRRTKNNPVLIGEPGVGKTAIAEGLALRIVHGDVPQSLKNKRVVALDMGAGDGDRALRSLIDDEIARWEVLDTGKPISEAIGYDVDNAADTLEFLEVSVSDYLAFKERLVDSGEAGVGLVLDSGRDSGGGWATSSGSTSRTGSIGAWRPRTP